MNKSEIINNALEKSMSYKEYRVLIDSLTEIGKTTGENHSEAMLNYTQMNLTRMNKWDKHYSVSEEAKASVKKGGKEIWLLITEAWCGDAAHSVPVLEKLSNENPDIDLRIVLRDENLDLMDLYLTNGGRSIPKLIRLESETKTEISNWGPRPKEAQQLVLDAKTNGVDHDEYTKNLQIWYARDRGKSLEKEMLETFELKN